MSATHFWDGAQVITVLARVTTRMAAGEYENMFCVDTFQQKETMRYGKFMPRNDGKDYPVWTGIPYDEFPKEFKMWLLLLA